jgi:hypothetical protein
MIAYRRDASWHNRPSTNSAAKCHRPSETDEVLAECSRQIVLNEKTALDFENVMSGERCGKCFTPKVLERLAAVTP